MNGSGLRMFRWLVAFFMVVGLLLTTGTAVAQEDDECIPADAAALLDPNSDGFISTQELEGFVALLRTIDPALYEGDLEGDIAAIEEFIAWMYANDVTGYSYTLCQVPDPTVPPEITPEPTIPPEITPEPTIPPEITPEPTAPPYVEPQPTAPPPPEEQWDEPVIPVEAEVVPVVAQAEPVVVSLPNTGSAPLGHSLIVSTLVFALASAAMILLGATLRVRKH